jgi:soluble lytic murein transglycosylase-like protein
MALGFFQGDNSPDSYEAIQRRRRMADALLAQSQSGAPIQSWTQGAAKLAQALSGTVQNNRLDAKERESAQTFQREMFGAIGGQPPRAPVSPSQAMTRTDVAGGKGAEIPPDLMPAFEQASRATGIPVSVLAAKVRQESSFNPNAVGRAGEIGLAQIMPSTARDPGFGMQGVDPNSLRDPAANIMFGAQYLAARGGRAGVKDWNDPQQVSKALLAYNGGGDPNYVQNVMRFMPPGQPGQQPAQMAQAGGAGPMPQPAGDMPASEAVPAGPMPGQPPMQPPQAPQMAQPVQPPPQGQQGGIAPQGLLALAMDPRFSPQQRQMAMQMFQVQQQQANRPPIIIPEGATLLDPRTNQMTQPTRRMTNEERNFTAQQGNPAFAQWQQQRDEARRPQNNVNVNNRGEGSYDQTMGKALAEDHRSLITAGRAAPGKIAKYEALQSALDRTYTGAGGQTVLQLKRFVKSSGLDRILGINVDDVGDAEFANALGNQLALELRNPAGGAGMPGALSDKDREFLVASIANVDKTPEGNKKLLNLMISLERRNEEVAKFANDYARRNNGRLDPAFFDELAQWSAQKPMFPESGAAPAVGASSAGAGGRPRLRFNSQTGEIE